MNKWSMEGGFIAKQHPGYALDNKNKVHASIHPRSAAGRSQRKRAARAKKRAKEQGNA